MTIRTNAAKPAIPYEGFPLHAHGSGMWAVKVLGKRRYFGPWYDKDGKSNGQAVLRKFNAERDHLYAGQQPPAEQNQYTLGELLNSFLRVKRLKLQAGELTVESLDEIERVTDQIITLGSGRPVCSIKSDDLDGLRSTICTGKRGAIMGPAAQRRRLAIARSVFNYANDVKEMNVRFKTSLRGPSAKLLRKAKNAIGERMFTPAEIKSVVAIASPELKAMTLLGINCGFGNHDCASLLIEHLDLVGGWHRLGRNKTEVMRRAPLWPETVSALRNVIKSRDKGNVFITKQGQTWHGKKNASPVSAEFRKLVREAGFYRANVTSFYSLRRTFSTIAEGAGQSAAAEHIMGHIAPASDMQAIYRQRISDESLVKVTDHVRAWLYG